MEKNEIVIYKSQDGAIKVDVLFEGKTVWLTMDQMTVLFGKSRSTINEHILNIYKEGELIEEDSMRKIGNSDFSTKPTNYYNLDVIISVGYRVKSKQGTQFRIWATQRLAEYIIKGFTMDDERLKQMGGGGYWKELLERIRDIRSSEKVLYRQVLDIYATAVDYDPRSDASIEFFKIVQNKLHYAAHGQTAAEVIYHRADADQPFMGLTTFIGNHPTLRDAKIAKNYLKEDEMKVLNNLVSGYFDFAEIQAMKHRPMYMSDYITQLDNILSSTGEPLLVGAGSVSHHQAMEKAETEYRKYQVRTLSPVEEAYLDTIKSLSSKVKK
ncbi:MAG: virulence RhuM family protein [Bacteroidaceae bacterium]|nr:virulence RhuM family protein [Bacteroidaceae bacterium]